MIDGSGRPLKDDHFCTSVFSNQRRVSATIRAAVAECLQRIRPDCRGVGDVKRITRVIFEEMLVVNGSVRSSSSDQLAQALDSGSPGELASFWH
jgi:hypothetical protein